MSRRARRRVALAAALGLVAAGCAGRAWDPEDLALRHPALREAGPGRLGAITPYLLPSHGTLILFLCRWTTAAPLPVSLPLDAEPEERRALQAALRAWEGAGLGVRFLQVQPQQASLVLELSDGPVSTATGTGSGNTVADCRLGAPSQAHSEQLPAELVSASVRLARRTPPDLVDRALAPAELAGAALHEIGHALGFQGHVWTETSALASSPRAIRVLGERVLAGEPWADPHLRALYAVPSGAVLRRAPVEMWRTDLTDRMAELGRKNALDGPFVRVGDRAARVFWRDARGLEYGLQVLNLEDVLRRPGRLLVVPEPRTRNALPRSRDLRP